MTYLLDVNLLFALCDPRHSYHESAHRWFKNNPNWATCPLTENAFIRISAKPIFASSTAFAAGQIDLLRRFCSLPTWTFWPDSISLLQGSIWRDYQTLSPGHLTDLYLLALAAKNRGKLATFDRRIPSHFIQGGNEALLVLDL